MGNCVFNPDIFRKSRCPSIACITTPLPRKSSALKKACVMRWNTPAIGASTPTATNMNPSCETVEYAKTFLRSNCRSAIVAAKAAVKAPTTLIVTIAPGTKANTGYIRVIMYTPAVTIVAAWIRAETGVGPSIASGSQTYSGNCALLPNAPSISMNGIQSSAHCRSAGTYAVGLAAISTKPSPIDGRRRRSSSRCRSTTR